jgi:hypothetical protein
LAARSGKTVRFLKVVGVPIFTLDAVSMITFMMPPFPNSQMISGKSDIRGHVPPIRRRQLSSPMRAHHPMLNGSVSVVLAGVSPIEW